MSEKTAISIPSPFSQKRQDKKSRKTLYGIFSLVFLVLVMVVLWKGGYLFSETLYIAVAGPMTKKPNGEKNFNGEAMVQGVQLAIDQINRKGGIHGKRVELLIFDDQNDPKLAKKQAQKIVDSKAIAVIGHYTSDASLAAAEVYKEQGIPAISGSATADKLTQGNDWYFRVIFNNSDQGTLLAYYVHNILGYDKASVFVEDDTYGSTLADTFIQTAGMIGLKIKHQWSFKPDEPDIVLDGGLQPRPKRFHPFTHMSEEVVNTLKEEKEEAGILFLATHSKAAAETIIKLRQKGSYRVPIIGADALASHAFSQKISQKVQEKYQPGYYTDGIYLTTPFLVDLAGKRAISFKKAFESKYQEVSTTAVIYYDAAQVIFHALEQFSPAKEIVASLQEKRAQLKEGLWEISHSNVAFEGVTGPIYFDRNGDVDKSIPIAVFNKGQPTVALSQYRQKSWTGSQQATENILPDVFRGNLIKANGKFRNKADVVYVGVEFNEISQLDTKEATYTVDFYLWFRFRNGSQFEANKIERVNIMATKENDRFAYDVGKVEFVNIVDSEDGELEKPTMVYQDSSITGDTNTRTYRVKAQFKGDFDFHNYPLDYQTLFIQLRHTHKTRDTLIYAVDTVGMRTEKLVENLKSDNAFSINSWQVNQISFYEDVQETDSTFGSPRFFHSEHRLEYSRLNVAIEIKREVVSFFLKNVFPNLLLIILGYGIFFISAFGTQLTLGVNLILPTSILHIRLSSELPTLAYFTLLEYTFYLIYFLAVSSLLMAIIMHFDEENKKRVDFIFLAGRIGYPIVAIGGILLAFWLGYLPK